MCLQVGLCSTGRVDGLRGPLRCRPSSKRGPPRPAHRGLPDIWDEGGSLRQFCRNRNGHGNCEGTRRLRYQEDDGLLPLVRRGGRKRGSDYWTEYHVKEDNPQVTVMNYINLDMAGVNWPGGGGAPHGDPDPEIDEDGYPKDSEVWPLRVYIGPGPNHDQIDQPGMVGLSNWIGADALGLEEQMGTLVGTNYSADTWKTDVWLDMDRPEVIVYEDTTARSDHASFQDNLGTVTVGFGGLVDGYWCYHQVCDTLEEMEEWMDTTGKGYGEENTGVANVVNSLDMITWWALMTFFHCDEVPVFNSLS